MNIISSSLDFVFNVFRQKSSERIGYYLLFSHARARWRIPSSYHHDHDHDHDTHDHDRGSRAPSSRSFFHAFGCRGSSVLQKKDESRGFAVGGGVTVRHMGRGSIELMTGVTSTDGTREVEAEPAGGMENLKP